MNISETIKKAQSNPAMWFRPVSWRGVGQAYCIDKDYWAKADDAGQTKLVPTDTGGIRSMTSDVVFLTDDWELVLPQEVIKEKK
jgi:hypothetical protein